MVLFPFWLLVLIFLAAVGAIWVAGIQLSRYTDVLAERLHLGAALGGLILLAITTNLPELAITVSAAIQGDLSIAVGNILGGIAIQTAVLALLDLIGVRCARSLTYRAGSLSLIVEAALVIAILAVVIAGSQMPADLIFIGLTPDTVLIAAIWVIGLLLVSGAGKGMSWYDDGQAPDSRLEPIGHSRAMQEEMATSTGTSTAKAARDLHRRGHRHPRSRRRARTQRKCQGRPDRAFRYPLRSHGAGSRHVPSRDLDGPRRSQSRKQAHTVRAHQNPEAVRL